MVKEKGDKATNIPKGQTKTIKNSNKSQQFHEWLKQDASSLNPKTDKMNTFSEELLKAVDSDGQDIRTWREYLDKAKLCFNMRMSNPEMPLVKKVHFRFFETFGIGAFSRVVLVKHIDKKTYYAAKLITKATLVHGRKEQQAHNEKIILQSIRFVFTVNLEFFFQDNVYLYLVMPLVPGGELFTYLTQVNRLKEDDARFYSAQMLLALEYLHSMGLIFRDLKPENILIDAIGYLKLTDFGFCKVINVRTYTFCGSAEYLAPEVWINRGYGKSADWWSFGVLLFELCAGHTPFCSDTLAKIYENISKCRYRIPYHFSTGLRNLIKHILQPDLTKRYGNLRKGVDDIKNHSFYHSMQWIMLLNRELQAPYIPVIKGPDDTSNFVRYDKRPLQTSSADLYSKEFADF